MKKYSIIAILLLTGCSAFSPPVKELSTVKLCYELLYAKSDRIEEAETELDTRGESCLRFKEQVSAMFEAKQRERQATLYALGMMQDNFNNKNDPIDTYIQSQKYLNQQQPIYQTPKIVHCNSYKIGNTTNMQCY